MDSCFQNRSSLWFIFFEHLQPTVISWDPLQALSKLKRVAWPRIIMESSMLFSHLGTQLQYLLSHCREDSCAEPWIQDVIRVRFGDSVLQRTGESRSTTKAWVRSNHKDLTKSKRRPEMKIPLHVSREFGRGAAFYILLYWSIFSGRMTL